MAEQATIARPYAQAVFDLAKANDAFDTWSYALSFLRQVICSSEVKNIRANPKSDKSGIKKLLLDICSEHLDSQANNLLKMLVDNQRLNSIDEIVEQFEALKAECLGSMKVHLVSTYAVRAPQKKEITEALSKRFGKTVELDISIDRNLLGGWVIRAGSQVIDFSVRGRLQGLNAELRH